MTVKREVFAVICAVSGAPGLTAICQCLFGTYPDVPQHPLDGPIPTD